MRLRTLAIIAAFIPAALSAQVAERNTTTTITTGVAPDFSGATYDYYNIFNLTPSYVGTFTNNFNIAGGAQNITTTGFNGVTTAPGTTADFSSTYLFDVTGTGTSNGQYTLTYNGGALGFISPTVIGGRYALSFSGGGTNGVDIGGIFNTTVSVLGDWTNPSNHTAIGFDPSYSVTDNFTFDGTYTNFSLSTSNFAGGTPGISFALLGAQVAAVPEPATWALMIFGFGAIGTTLRRSQRATTNVLAKTA